MNRRPVRPRKEPSLVATVLVILTVLPVAGVGTLLVGSGLGSLTGGGPGALYRLATGVLLLVLAVGLLFRSRVCALIVVGLSGWATFDLLWPIAMYYAVPACRDEDGIVLAPNFLAACVTGPVLVLSIVTLVALLRETATRPKDAPEPVGTQTAEPMPQSVGDGEGAGQSSPNES